MASAPGADAAGLHFSSSIGEGQFLESMGDPERSERLLRPSAKGLHSLQHRSLAFGVQKCRGLVEKEQACITCQGSRDGQSLLLPSAEGMDGTLLKPFKPEFSQQHLHSGGTLIGRLIPWHPQHQVASCGREQQLMIRVLKDKSRSVRCGDASRLWLQQACNQAKQGALATAVASHQHPQSRPWNGEVTPTQGGCSTGPAVTQVVNPKFCRWRINPQGKSLAACCHR